MNKVIIITGASSGIGLALGNYFHQKNFTVFGLSRKINKQAAFRIIPTDITNSSDLDNAFSIIKRETEGVDCLINNAGRGMVGAIENATAEEITELFNLNVIAMVQSITHVLPMMRERKKGKIITISSIASRMGLPFRGFYSASKASVDKITEALRYELTSTSIQACTVNLGDVKTKIAQNRIVSKHSSEYEEIFNAVYKKMNQEVDKGITPESVAPFIEKLIYKQKLKAHYYFGPSEQKLSLLLKTILPENIFEFIIKKYSDI